MVKDKTISFFEKYRRALSAVAAVLCGAFVLVTHHSWPEGSALDLTLDIGGAALVLMGIGGRAWCTMYIGGRKNQELVDKGPYSMTRNPLYFSSFLAGLGICLEVGNVYVIAAYLVFFPLYYHFVIQSEEKRLAGLFSEAFDRYKQTTPAFFPNIAIYDSGELAEYSPELVKRTVRDGSVFVLVLAVVIGIELLQGAGVLPVLWTVP
jgi:protein-S-isoprenylcysteine O-methyltransferase Ste14